MTDQFTSGSPSLISRVQNILMKPKAEWDVIRGEATSVQALFTGYAMILAAIPAIAGLIGGVLLASMFGGIAIGLVGGIVGAILGYVLGLASVFITGLIIEVLAPQFGAQKDRTQAMKVAVYAMTPAWVAGVLTIIPLLGILVLVAALYGAYLLYLGLKQVLGTPDDKGIVYAIVVIVIMFVINWIAIMIVTAVTASLAVGAAAASVMAFG